MEHQAHQNGLLVPAVVSLVVLMPEGGVVEEVVGVLLVAVGPLVVWFEIQQLHLQYLQ
jgi:hypothetical protein